MRKHIYLAVIVLFCCFFIMPVSASVPDSRGDVNGDSAVNAQDALAVLKHVAILDTLSSNEMRRADVNRDYDCDAKDALGILKYSAALISSFDEISETILVKTAEVDLENVRIVRTRGGYEDHREVKSRIISSYEEYVEYINYVEKYIGYSSRYDDVDLYLPEFFDSNVLFVADFWEGSGSITHKFLDVTESEGKTVIKIEKFSPFIQTCDMAHWDVMVPLAGKERKLENISVEFEHVHELGGWYFEFTDAVPSVSNGENYLQIISTYEEYMQYMALVKENNPDFNPKHEYTEDSFDSFNIIAGGFWHTGGPLELKDIESRVRNDAVNINFEFICPSDYTEDKYFYTFILSYDKFSYTDISYTTDVEYYDSPTVNGSDILKLEVEVDDRNDEWYRDIVLINTYEEYVKYLNSLEDNAIGDYSSISNYDEAYFEENVIVVAEYVDESYSIESSFVEITDYEDEFIVSIRRTYPDILNEGVKQWCIFIPLEGKEWAEKEARISLKEIGEDEVLCRAQTMWVPTVYDYSYGENESPQYIIISDYEEYKKYTDFIKSFRQYTNRTSYRAERYNEEYFEENVLLFFIIDGTEEPYDADIVSSITDSGEIVLDIERSHDTRYGNNGSFWNVFIPLPGDDWVVDNVTINYTDTYPYEK